MFLYHILLLPYFDQLREPNFIFNWASLVFVLISIVSVLFQNIVWPVPDPEQLNDSFGAITTLHILKGKPFYLYISFILIVLFHLVLWGLALVLFIYTVTKNQMNKSFRASIRFIILFLSQFIYAQILSVSLSPLCCNFSTNKSLLSNNAACYGGMHYVPLFVSVFLGVTYITHCVAISFFTFSAQMKHGGTFASRSGTFQGFLHLAISIEVILAVVLKEKQTLHFLTMV